MVIPLLAWNVARQLQCLCSQPLDQLLWIQLIVSAALQTTPGCRFQCSLTTPPGQSTATDLTVGMGLQKVPGAISPEGAMCGLVAEARLVWGPGKSGAAMQ